MFRFFTVRDPQYGTPGMGAPSGGGSPSGSPSGGDRGGAPGSPGPSGGSPSPSPGSPSGAPGAIAPGGSPGPGGSGTPGPVDYARFEEVNQRANALAWAQDHDPTEVQESLELMRFFDTDPEGALEYVTNLLRRRGHNVAPRNGQGNNGTNGGANQPFTDPRTGRPLPDVVIRETGAKFYSAEQSDRLLEWQQQQFESRLAPLEGSMQANQNTAQARSMIADAEANWEGFKEHAKDIFAEMRKDKRISMETAYRRVVVPKLGALKRTAVMQELQQKGQAGTGTHNPGSAAPTSTVETRKLPIKELLKREFARRGMGPQ